MNEIIEGVLIPETLRGYRLIISTPQGVFFPYSSKDDEFIQHRPTNASTKRFIELSDHLEVMDVIALAEGVLLLVFPKRGELVYKGSKKIN